MGPCTDIQCAYTVIEQAGFVTAALPRVRDESDNVKAYCRARCDESSDLEECYEREKKKSSSESDRVPQVFDLTCRDFHSSQVAWHADYSS
jgi:hypothetical protein